MDAADGLASGSLSAKRCARGHVSPSWLHRDKGLVAVGLGRAACDVARTGSGLAISKTHRSVVEAVRDTRPLAYTASDAAPVVCAVVSPATPRLRAVKRSFRDHVVQSGVPIGLIESRDTPDCSVVVP